MIGKSYSRENVKHVRCLQGSVYSLQHYNMEEKEAVSKKAKLYTTGYECVDSTEKVRASSMVITT